LELSFVGVNLSDVILQPLLGAQHLIAGWTLSRVGFQVDPCDVPLQSVVNVI